MHTCSTWFENVLVVLELSYQYFYQLFPFFDLVFFPGPISIETDALWAQFLLEFSTNHFETMHIYSKLSEDVRVWVILPLICFDQLFPFC